MKKLKEEILLVGKGTDLSDKNVLQNRARRKLIAQTIMLNLISYCEEIEDYSLYKSYWNAYYCQSGLVTSKGRSFGNYCQYRFCPICSGIRKVRLLSKYMPIISKWESPYFMTLTSKSPSKNRISKAIQKRQRAFDLIYDRLNKRHIRNGGVKIMGIKTMESNFNPVKLTYNPHYHLIVNSEAAANLLMEEWLKQWPSKYVFKGGQHMRPVTDIEKDLIEVIKYSTKVFTEPDGKEANKKSKIPRKIYIAAMHEINKAFHNKKLIRKFGFTMPKETKQMPPTRTTRNYTDWEYDINKRNWINTDTGTSFVDFNISPRLDYTLNNIDRKLH
jgi:hypothetical protein